MMNRGWSVRMNQGLGEVEEDLKSREVIVTTDDNEWLTYPICETVIRTRWIWGWRNDVSNSWG